MTEPGKPSPLPDRYVRRSLAERNRYKSGGWASALLIVTVFIGWAAPWHEDPPATTDCTPVDVTDSPSVAATLMEQGYEPIRPGYLVAPGCQP